MQERKNLANCSPKEFLRQTSRVRRSVERWLKETKIMEIRSRKVEGIETVPDDADLDTKYEIRKRNAERITAQQKKNFGDILTAIMDDHPDETLELLALLCFVEPEDVEKYSTAYYLGNFAELITNKDVINFFTSLAQLAQTGILHV